MTQSRTDQAHAAAWLREAGTVVGKFVLDVEARFAFEIQIRNVARDAIVIYRGNPSKAAEYIDQMACSSVRSAGATDDEIQTLTWAFATLSRIPPGPRIPGHDVMDPFFLGLMAGLK